MMYILENRKIYKGVSPLTYMKITQFKVNNENLHIPILILEDGSEKMVNTLILRRVYGYSGDINIITIGQEFKEKEILEEYQKEAKITIPELKEKITDLRREGKEKGFYKYLDFRGKYLWEILKEFNLLKEISA